MNWKLKDHKTNGANKRNFFIVSIFYKKKSSVFKFLRNWSQEKREHNSIYKPWSFYKPWNWGSIKTVKLIKNQLKQIKKMLLKYKKKNRIDAFEYFTVRKNLELTANTNLEQNFYSSILYKSNFKFIFVSINSKF